MNRKGRHDICLKARILNGEFDIEDLKQEWKESPRQYEFARKYNTTNETCRRLFGVHPKQWGGYRNPTKVDARAETIKKNMEDIKKRKKEIEDYNRKNLANYKEREYKLGNPLRAVGIHYNPEYAQI